MARSETNGHCVLLKMMSWEEPNVPCAALLPKSAKPESKQEATSNKPKLKGMLVVTDWLLRTVNAVKHEDWDCFRPKAARRSVWPRVFLLQRCCGSNRRNPRSVPRYYYWSTGNFLILKKNKQGEWRSDWEFISAVQFSRSVVPDSLWPHESQHTRPPCPSPTPTVHSNSRPSSEWCHPAISSSVVPFSSCPQSLPASESCPMSQLFAWGGQSIAVSASASVLPKNTQGWSPLGWTGWISLQSKGLSRVFFNTTLQKHQFFSAQLSSQSNSHIHTWPLEKPQPWLNGPLLAK